MDVSFFVQMGWKSALIAGAALGLAYVLRSRAASDRAMVLRIGVTMLLLLPLAALALPALQIEAFSAPETPAAAAAAPGDRAGTRLDLSICPRPGGHASRRPGRGRRSRPPPRPSGTTRRRSFSSPIWAGC